MNGWPYTPHNAHTVGIDHPASTPTNVGYNGQLWPGYAQQGGAQGLAVGQAAQPPFPADISYPPPLPEEQAAPPPLPSEDLPSAPLSSSDAAPPLPEDPPAHGSAQGYSAASHPWAPQTAQYPASQTPGAQGMYPSSYQAGSASVLPSVPPGQPPWSRTNAYDANLMSPPWAAHISQPGAHPQQQYASSGYAQQYPNQAAYGPTAAYGHAQPPPGTPPNPYAQMYGQQQAWRGVQGYQQMETPTHGQAAQQYQQQQQPGAWGPHLQQPSWTPSPQPSAAANGYAQQQPQLPAAQAVPAHADIPDRPALPLNVTLVEDLLSGPGRAKRPKLIAVVLRGLPGSGKSLIARRLRDAEVAAGGSGPRIHCIDDYFVTDVEKEVLEKDASGKRKVKLVRETEYCYEADMEGVYKASLLKAFRRTVEEGRSTFVIVDAPNLRIEDFKPYWDAGQRAGYEVYVLQAPETDPQVCFERNTHSRTLEDIKAAAQQWEPAPPSFPQLDPASLLRPSSKPQAGIKEVDMEDDSTDEAAERDPESAAATRAKGRWANLDNGAEAQAQRPKKAQRSRFSETPKAPDSRRDQGTWKSKKRVRWADEAEEEDTGFHIGGASLRQLETVYVLEGLGPPKEQSYGQKSFSEQVKADHKSEQHNFRDILLGNRRPT